MLSEYDPISGCTTFYSETEERIIRGERAIKYPGKFSQWNILVKGLEKLGKNGVLMLDKLIDVLERLNSGSTFQEIGQEISLDASLRFNLPMKILKFSPQGPEFLEYFDNTFLGGIPQDVVEEIEKQRKCRVTK